MPAVGEPTGPARPAFARSASYGGYESADLASPAEAVMENRLGLREGFAKAGARSAKAEVAGPMTSSMTPFCERLCAGVTKSMGLLLLFRH
jgi:hypothetical protein